MSNKNQKLSLTLIGDELFDLSLYQSLHKYAKGDFRILLEDLIAIETKHLAFWEDFFKTKRRELNLWRRIKLYFIVFISYLGGEKVVHLILEAIEIYGIRKYLLLSRVYKGTEFALALRGVLRDELSHEEKIVSRFAKRNINPEKIRNIFLGFNDGLVEMLGATSGFFAAFNELSSILIAVLTVATAGSLSMAAGIYVASNSEAEIKELEREKDLYLKRTRETSSLKTYPFISALIVGISYLLGALVPIIPIFFGAHTIFYPIIFAGSMIIAVSTVFAFLSGMEIKKRITLNFVIIAAATIITYALGILAKNIAG